MFQSSLCHRELLKFLLCKYWHTQWASATFCLSLSSSEAQYNNSLCWIFFLYYYFECLCFPVGRIEASKNKLSRNRVQLWHCAAQKFNKVTFCTFSTGSQECICYLILGSILTLLNVHVSGSGILCQSISGHPHSWGQVGVPKQANVQPEAAIDTV